MEVLQVILYYLLIALIAIGDMVLFLIKGTVYLLTWIYFVLIKSLRVSKNLLINIEQKLIRFIFLVQSKLFHRRTHKNRYSKNYRGKKPITVFQVFNTTSKIKYFFLGSFFSAVIIFIPLVFLLLLAQLPNPKALSSRQIPQTTKIYDRNGALLAQIYSPIDRTIVPLSDIPKHLIQATIAIEDKNFYHHPGFDIAAILRALKENLSGKSFQGGSTITQQLIKSSFLTSEPTLKRKIKEIILSFWAERIYSKDEILAMYFNQIPYGGTSWGVGAASQVYFGKNVKDLTLAESAFLAGITAAPTTYSPFGHKPNLWKKRQKEVLSNMVKLGFITQSQAEKAAREPLKFKQQQVAIYAPHFVAYVKDLLAKRYGLAMVERGGLNVRTSLDLTLQKQAEQIVRDEVEKENYLHLTNGAMLVTDPKTGDILAMVGSYNFNDPLSGNVNVTTSLRQPGSSIKVVTYALALSHGFTAATILEDSPVTYKSPNGATYSPVNYDGKFYGKLPLRYALGNSLNIPAVKVLSQLGVEKMVALGKNMGITSWGNSNQYGLSITLGGADVTMLDMATVYGTLANKGKRVELNPIISVTDYQGQILEQKTITPKQVIDQGVAFILSNILSDSSARLLAFGPNSILSIPNHIVSVKTGTSDDKRDNWTIGYTENYVVTVWVGNNDNTPMSQQLASGITGAAPIWHKMMKYLLEKNPEGKPTIPKNIIAKPCYGRIEYFIKGTESINCNWHFSPSPTRR